MVEEPIPQEKESSGEKGRATPASTLKSILSPKTLFLKITANPALKRGA